MPVAGCHKSRGKYIVTGGDTTALGNDSHAEGNCNAAIAPYSHAEGRCNAATYDCFFKILTSDDSTKTITLDSSYFGFDNAFAKVHDGMIVFVNFFNGTSIKNGKIISKNEADKSIVVDFSIPNTTGGMAYCITGGDGSNCAHAEGNYTTASGSASHSEGCQTIASGYTSHAEGTQSKASGITSHAEGSQTTAQGNFSHAEGFQTKALSEYSHAEGSGSTASGAYSHAEGASTVASGTCSHAEGNITEASGSNSHAEGCGTTASNDYSHAEGNNSNALGPSAHAEGDSTRASSGCSHAEGYNSTASGDYSHAEGSNTRASGQDSHAEGLYAIASNYASHAGGKYNKEMSASGTFNNTTGDVLVIGNGTGTSARSNAFRITYAGAVYGKSAFNSTGADYAEYFEWSDGNPDNEDRVGYFVTMEDDKICIARPGNYILGIVSGQPCIIGNADEDWLGRWEHDEFGRFIIEDVDTPITELREIQVPILDDKGNPIQQTKMELQTETIANEDGTTETITKEVLVPVTDDEGNPVYETRPEMQEFETGEINHGWRHKANSEYDSTQQYIERKDRLEWSAIGMLGVLSVRDDGSCTVNGFCKVNDGGIATAASDELTIQDGKIVKAYRVIERVSDNVVKVVFR